MVGLNFRQAYGSILHFRQSYGSMGGKIMGILTTYETKPINLSFWKPYAYNPARKVTTFHHHYSLFTAFEKA